MNGRELSAPSCTMETPTLAHVETPTLAHVAALAGVSPATASRVINGTARVSPRARSRVEEAVQRLGYVRHRAAPADRRSGSIAAVVCEDDARVFTDHFFARLFSGVRRELGDDRELVVLIVGRAGRWGTVAEYLRGGRADGVLLISAHGAPAMALRQTGVPVLLAERPLWTTPLPYVDADNRGGARTAVDYLLKCGRQTIGTIAGPPDRAVGVDRLAGYRAAVGDAGLPTSGLITYGDLHQASGEHAMNRLLDRRPDIDAVLCASDQMAVGALRALSRTGRRVPDDVAVVGFDDSPIAGRVRPRLTTVRRPIEDMGVRMARELLGRIAGEASSGQGVVLNTKLIIRDSA
ncbi:LacI family DNA-binding transcriptional regulator [Actinoallomurus liliacearum]|uniref:LacI family DNA-binding transcriptional regulator n=2 Tax=Actinoallomurus liliacearum TaxID=1080073 RepID=A0ABP8TNZ0_9ACTN